LRNEVLTSKKFETDYMTVSENINKPDLDNDLGNYIEELENRQHDFEIKLNYLYKQVNKT
jgi:hypothetical protein